MSEFDNALPWGGMRRCVVNQDGTVAYYLHPENSNYKEDGTPVDWTEVENNVQNVMVEIPKFYYCKKKVGDDWIFGVADAPVETDKISIDEWKVHPAFYRDRTKLCDDQSANPVEVDYRYIGAFHGWVDGANRLRSLPNKMPTVSKTISTFRDHAKNMGVGWSQWDYYLLYAIQMLYITEYGHGDSQTMIGRGYVDNNSSATVTGGTLQYGNKTFGETTGKQQMSYRGIEDFWGNVSNLIDGLYYDGSRNILIGNKGFNNTGVGYENIGQEATGNISGYIGDIQPHEKAGFIIKVGGGGAFSKLYDYGLLYVNRFPYFGGDRDDGSNAGAFRLGVNYSSTSSSSSVGARLAL